MYIDSHAHLTSAEILPDIDALIERAIAAKIETIVNICTGEASLQAGIALHERYPFVVNSAAATPHDVGTIGEQFFPLVKQAAEKKQLVAIGETGLDYHYEHSDRKTQQEHLLRYIELAKATELPLIFHCRDAFADLFYFTDQHYAGHPALVHCFTGNEKEALAAVERGWYISVSGIATFKKSEALRQAIMNVPLNRLLIETDTPYLAPQSKRGKRNEPSFITETAEALALLLKRPLQEIAAATTANANQFFSFSKRS